MRYPGVADVAAFAEQDRLRKLMGASKLRKIRTLVTRVRLFANKLQNETRLTQETQERIRGGPQMQRFRTDRDDLPGGNRTWAFD